MPDQRISLSITYSVTFCLLGADKNKFNGAAAEMGDDSVFEDTIHYSIDPSLGGRQRQTVARSGARAVTVIPSPTFKVSSYIFKHF